MNVFCLLILTTIRHDQFTVQMYCADKAGVCILRVEQENRFTFDRIVT